MSPLSDESDEKLTADSAESHATRGSCRSSMMDVASMALRYRQFLKAIAASEFPDSLKPREDDFVLVQEALLSDVTLVTTKRKPFDFFVERLDLKKSRNICRSFEPWTPARDAFATAFFGEREPHLNELCTMSESMT